MALEEDTKKMLYIGQIVLMIKTKLLPKMIPLFQILTIFK